MEVRSRYDWSTTPRFWLDGNSFNGSGVQSLNSHAYLRTSTTTERRSSCPYEQSFPEHCRSNAIIRPHGIHGSGYHCGTCTARVPIKRCRKQLASCPPLWNRGSGWSVSPLKSWAITGLTPTDILGNVFLFIRLRTMEHKPLSNRLIRLTARHVPSQIYLLMIDTFLD